MEGRTVVGLGELLWDLFPDGRRLGGAPANVAYHASVLGDRGVVATRVGQDAAGDEALALLGGRGVDVTWVQRDPARPTGVAEVRLSGDGEARFCIDATAAWSAPAWTDDWERLFSTADALCFGTLLCAEPAGLEVVERAVRSLPSGALRLLDLNLRPPHTTDRAVENALACANALKLSEEEVAALCPTPRAGVEDLAADLLVRLGFRVVAITRGSRGSLLYTRGGRHAHPGFAIDPDAEGDPVGAGDAFTATLAHHLVRGHPPARAQAAANRYAAHVASCAGAMPEVDATLRQQVTGLSGR